MTAGTLSFGGQVGGLDERALLRLLLLSESQRPVGGSHRAETHGTPVEAIVLNPTGLPLLVA